MKKEELYAWMNNQIVATTILNTPVDLANPYYIKNASANGNRIHVFGIDNLCNDLHKPYRVRYHSDEFDEHYFKYMSFEFFGLVDKEK